MPCGQIHTDVCLRVGFSVVSRIRVRHGVFLGILEKVCWWALGRRVLKRVFGPRVVVCVGGGGIHTERDFVFELLGGHGVG